MKHPQKVKCILEKWLYSKLGKIHPANITARSGGRLHWEHINSGSPTVANDALRHIKKNLRYDLVLGWLPVNVAADIDQYIASTTEQVRDRYLTISEIKKLFIVMARNRDWFGRDNELAIQLLLMLGVRKTELIAATWSAFDFDNARSHQSAAKQKMALLFHWHLSPLIICFRKCQKNTILYFDSDKEFTVFRSQYRLHLHANKSEILIPRTNMPRF